MAAPREVSWLEIRRVWEGTLLSDAEVAAQFGFNSKTTILRRRRVEGWKRDEKAIEVSTSKLAAGLPDTTPPTSGVTAGVTPVTPAPNCQTEQIQASDTPDALGVTGKTGERLSIRWPSQELARKADTADEIIEDWKERQARAKRRHLRYAVKMQETSAKLMAALDGVLDGPASAKLMAALDGGLDGSALTGEEYDDYRTPYGMAIIALRAINPDKDTLAGLTKAAADAMDKGIKLERLVLGLDGGADDEKPADLPAGIMSAEDLVALGAKSFAVLEALSDLGREAEQQRPRTIDGQSVRVK